MTRGGHPFVMTCWFNDVSTALVTNFNATRSFSRPDLIPFLLQIRTLNLNRSEAYHIPKVSQPEGESSASTVQAVPISTQTMLVSGSSLGFRSFMRFSLVKHKPNPLDGPRMTERYGAPPELWDRCAWICPGNRSVRRHRKRVTKGAANEPINHQSQDNNRGGW